MDINSIDDLIKYKYNFNKFDYLELSIKFDYLDGVKCSLTSKNIHYNNDYFFILAVKLNHLNIVKYLIKNGINLDENINEALYFALENNKKQNIQKLIMYLCGNSNLSNIRYEIKLKLNIYLRNIKIKKIINEPI